MYTTESDSAIRYTPQSLTQRYDTHGGVSESEYLIEIETKENILCCLSGAQMGSNHEKIEVENLVTHSL